MDLGWLGDERLHRALECLAKAVTGQGIAPTEETDAPLRFLKSGTCGPRFCCSANNKLPCAWGAVKVMLAFSKLPDDARTPLIQEAIKTGLEFLLSRDPAVADYPMGYSTKPNRSWFKFGFPLTYWSDVLETIAVLVELGYGEDPRLSNALQLILGKQDTQGRWKLENALSGKMWANIEKKGKPSKWVTLRALRVLKHVATQAGG